MYNSYLKCTFSYLVTHKEFSLFAPKSHLFFTWRKTLIMYIFILKWLTFKKSPQTRCLKLELDQIPLMFHVSDNSLCAAKKETTVWKIIFFSFHIWYYKCVPSQAGELFLILHFSVCFPHQYWNLTIRIGEGQISISLTHYKSCQGPFVNCHSPAPA